MSVDLREPTTELDGRFGDPDATTTPWATGRKQLEDAELYWITTVRQDGRPHVTPLAGVWHERALYFCTGPGEQKYKNLAANARCILTTGCNSWKEGLDLVVEGEAVRVTDEALLRKLADTWSSKYDGDWQYEVRDGAFHHEAGEAHVFEVAPDVAFGFGKGGYSQTRWRF